MGLLRDYLPRHTYGVVGTYRDDQLVAAVSAVTIDEHDRLVLQFPSSHPFEEGDLVTVQLDSRMDVAHLTEELPVNRTSYRGRVLQAQPSVVEVSPDQFQIYYSDKLLEDFRRPGYQFPTDERPVTPLPESTFVGTVHANVHEAQAGLGVLFTRSFDRPHSTVMAFLSTRHGDSFLITQPKSFKVYNLIRDRRGLFAIDFRDTYDLERPVDWAYRLQAVKASKVSPDRKLFAEVQTAFLKKSPWNANFFHAPGALMLHLTGTKYPGE